MVNLAAENTAQQSGFGEDTARRELRAVPSPQGTD
jgi:hypothetical protein